MKKDKRQKAVFLDRDGTICEEANYLSRPEDLRLFPFSAEAVKLLNDSGFLVILITNQSGIARSFFDENALHEIHAKLQDELAESNAKLDAIYFCPHSSNDNCACRKPKTGMIEQSAKDFLLDLENSWIVGDKAIDVETGFNAQLKTALVLTGYGQTEVEKLKKKPSLISENLLQAVKIIILP
ncbi:MAG: D-glycero-beta-D-manno-heptose 1,7-bisphosphate 7-phosphatase [Acidobacteriota bacterium]|nr:D-glycero-beta-D-manno-heptose 1,7-bisphosphate 7-phosphatase [Acidobacteriota bacterium]